VNLTVNVNVGVAFAASLLKIGIFCGDWGSQSGTGEESAEDDALDIHFR
jgi:hypothetical protein